MIVQICADTNPGLVRDHNEDSIAFDAASGLCILADGMGGHNAGEIASGMATAFLKSELRQRIVELGKHGTAADMEMAMVQSVTLANSAIYNMSRGSPQYAGMGTTLVVGVFRDDSLVLGHIGDSRCYRLRGDQLQQITRDHSIRQEQIDTGLITAEQALSPMGQNMVTRALGVNQEVQTEVTHHGVMTGDVYLMCSDGLSDMLTDETITAIVLSTESLDDKAKQLIIAANEAGGLDNVSVLLARVATVGKKAGLLSSARRAMRGVWPGVH